LADKLPLLAKLDALRRQLKDYRADKLPRVMVMSDAQLRETKILSRGEYLNPTEKVSFATPAFLPPLPVVEDLNVFRDLPDCLLLSTVTTVIDELVLERTPETLHGGVVVAVALAAHRRFHAELRKKLLKMGTAILASPIRVMDKALKGTFCRDCPDERPLDEFW
jgi:hypothetical protein